MDNYDCRDMCVLHKLRKDGIASLAFLWLVLSHLYSFFHYLFGFDILVVCTEIVSAYLTLPTDEAPQPNDGEALKYSFQSDSYLSSRSVANKNASWDLVVLLNILYMVHN